MSKAISQRYAHRFARLRAAQSGALVPFTVLGDPDLGRSRRILAALVEAGADALELGIPFSDPVADGPVIQRADDRALRAGTRPGDALALVAEVRAAYPALPLGLLVYANLLVARGISRFYADAAAAGVDSVLIADVPVLEAEPFAAAAAAQGVAPVLIATSNSSQEHLRGIARLCKGYTYVVTRAGVTGTESAAETSHAGLIRALAELGAPPCLLGFGISRPEQVAGALAAGAAGVISGSAVVERIERQQGDLPAMLESLRTFVGEMKAAATSRG